MNDSKQVAEPWVVYRCWAGVASTMVPHATKLRFSSQQDAERVANELTHDMSATGTWFEVRHAEVDPE